MTSGPSLLGRAAPRVPSSRGTVRQGRLGTVRDTFLPFSPPSLGEAEIEEVIDTLRSDWITTGPKVKRFEADFAAYLGAPDALAVFSCTDALQVALAALGVGPGDAVFTTTMTFCASAHVVEHLGATPILVDIDATSLNIDPLALAKVIDEVKAEGRLTPKAMIPVHHSGLPCEMDELFALARRHNLAVIEDAAHAVPARYKGGMIGAPRDEGVPHGIAFSFYATKNLTTAEGGMLTGTPSLVEEARLWALHGMSRDAWKRYGKGGSWFYEVIRPGFKCNMTDLQASLGIHQLKRLDGFQSRRREVVAAYSAAFGAMPELQVPVERPEVSSAWHLYVLRLNLETLTIDRGAFIDLLTEENIGVSVHFIPLHMHPFYRDKYALTPELFPVAQGEYERMISLPLNPRLSDADVADVIEAVTSIVVAHRA